MAVGIKKTGWITKPPLGTRVNRNSSLCNGIIFCTALNESSGYPTELITGKLATPGRLPTWTSGQRGAALNIAGTGNAEYFRFTNDARYVIAPTEMTLAVIVFPTVWGNDTMNELISCDGAFQVHYESFAGHGYAGFTLANWAGGNKNLRYLNSDPSLNAWHVLVGVITGSSPSLIYVDGVSKATTTTTAVAAQVLTNDLFICGGGDAGIITSPKARLELTVIWNRALTSSEIIQFSMNPYQIFEPRRTVFNTAVVGTTLTGARSLQLNNSVQIIGGRGF